MTKLETPIARVERAGSRTRYPQSGMDEALATFRGDFPAYDSTAKLDELRATEYARLDREGHLYLDYTGGGLYAESQLSAHMALLRDNVFGNPHSSNPSSWAATQLVERARHTVLDFFHASPDEYLVIFTANASGALKLVGESYPFQPGSCFLLTYDNHNSVTGIREFAHRRGADVIYSPVVPPDLRIDANSLRAELAAIRPDKPCLFAYPAQSNFSGVQHSLEWVAEAKAAGWDVLLDGAAFTPTNRLDLSRVTPDFVSLSFYKIMGYPTGIGALIARKDALAKLQRPWYAGGTILFASVVSEGRSMAPGAAAFEDGTVNYLGIPAVEIGLNYIAGIGIDVIHERVRCLAGWLLQQLAGLRHSNGRPVAIIYGPANTEARGGTLTLNFFDPHGRLNQHLDVEISANQENTSLRTGCFCNPGAREKALDVSEEELKSFYRQTDRMTLEQFMTAMRKTGGEGRGAVRISLGLASNFADTYRFMQFAETFVDREA